MKNKAACLRCRKTDSKCLMASLSYSNKEKKYHYKKIMDFFHKQWKIGEVYCTYFCAELNVPDEVRNRSIQEFPPHNCPYLLEHTVNQ